MQNLPKWARKSVLGPDFDQFFRVEKPNTYSIKLHCITAQNFRPIWPYLGELWPKTTQKQPKIIFPATKQTFGMSTCLTYETWPRYVPPQHLSLNKKWGWESKGSRGRIRKTIKKLHEINEILTLTSPYKNLQNAVKVGIFLLSSLTISLYCWKIQGRGA